MKIDKQIEKVFEDVIVMLYKDAKTKQTVARYLMETYDLEFSRGYEIIRDAKVYFGKFMIEEDTESLNECISILKSNREKASEQGNLSEVRESTKEIAKLQQLYIQKLEVTQTVWSADFGVDLDTDDLGDRKDSDNDEEG